MENCTGGLWFDLEGQPLDRGGIWNLHGAYGERLEMVSILNSIMPVNNRDFTIIEGQAADSVHLNAVNAG